MFYIIADQQLNFQELSRMLTNATLLNKFENILLKKQSLILQKLSSKTTKKEPTSTSPSFTYSTDLNQRENTNLKSNKKSKLLEEFKKEEEYFIDGKSLQGNKLETKIFTYSPPAISNRISNSF